MTDEHQQAMMEPVPTVCATCSHFNGTCRAPTTPWVHVALNDTCKSWRLNTAMSPRALALAAVNVRRRATHGSPGVVR